MVSRGATQQSSATFNRRMVLDIIRRAGEASRKDIIDQVGLSPQTVANITQDLETIGLVTGKRLKDGGGRGQPPIAFTLNPEGGDSIGISLEPRLVSAARVNLVGEIIDRKSVAIDASDQKNTLAVMVDLVKKLVKLPGRSERLWGIGVALPGPFDVPGMSFVGPTAFDGWHDLSILNALQHKVKLPVLYNIDSVAGALGELLFGVASDMSNFFYLHLGIGLGGTLLMDKAAYRGVSGNATEIGHIPIIPHGKSCYCGSFGCLERYLSLQALAEHLGVEDAATLQTGGLDSLLATDDELLMAWCQQAASHLRSAVCIIENMLDPQAIVLGGFAPRALTERLVALAMPLKPSVRSGAGGLRIMLSDHQADSALLGAAVLPIYHALSPRFELLLQGRAPATTLVIDSNVLLGRSTVAGVQRV